MALLQEQLILPKNIVAMSIETPEGERPQPASLTQIAAGTQVTILGEGFNDRTLKVRYRDGSYFIFLRDIEEPDSSCYLP